MKHTKHGAIDLTDLAIGVIVLGIVVTIGSTILINTRDSRLGDLSIYTTSHETVNASSSGNTLSNKWVQGLSSVVNASNGTQAVPASNYSLSVSSLDGTGTVTFSANSAFLNKNVNVSYSSYNTTRADWTVANNASIGIGEYGNWFKILVIVGVASVVLALIFMAFGRNSSVSSSGSY